MEKLGASGRRLVSVPSVVHGAPETAEVSASVVKTSLQGQRIAMSLLRLAVDLGHNNCCQHCRRAERLCSDSNVWQALSLKISILRWSGVLHQAHSYGHSIGRMSDHNAYSHDSINCLCIKFPAMLAFICCVYFSKSVKRHAVHDLAMIHL